MNTADLYKELILDHSKNPKNFGKLEYANKQAEGFNPLCGDHYFVDVIVNGDTITDIKFRGEGCAISKASASIMTDQVKGRSLKLASELNKNFHRPIVGEQDQAPNEYLQAFESLKDFPTRTKCASLPWHTLKEALNK